jgi:hypothetical protein
VLDQEVALQTKVSNLSRIHSVISHGVVQHGLDKKILTPLKGTKLKSLAKRDNANTGDCTVLRFLWLPWWQLCCHLFHL